MTIYCLLIEDHDISREFLAQALAQLPCEVSAAESLAEAIVLVKANSFDVWLCDMHLGDAEGETILAQLRHHAPKHAKNTKAIAITADLEKDVGAGLRTAGFVDVLSKPISMMQLHNAVKRVVHFSPTVAPMDSNSHWDETAALAAVGGQQNILDALRPMFLSDLPKQKISIENAFQNQDIATLKSELHKLLAACGFVGAAELSYKVKALSTNPMDKMHLDTLINSVNHYLKHASG
jgi:CheY-like chemotaxis protein